MRIIYLQEVKPREEVSFRLIVPFNLAVGLKGQVHNYEAVHTKEFPERLGIQVNFGYLPKGKSSFPVISTAGKFDVSSQENIIWMDSNIKQFTLGPIYIGVKK